MRQRLSIVAAFVRRDFTTALSYRVPYAFDLFAVLVNVVMFFYVGKLIEPGRGASEHLSQGYFPFVLVGLSLFGVASAALTRFSTAIRDEQVAGTLEVLLAQPVSPRLLIVGSAAYELMRAVVTGFVTLLTGVLVFGVRLTDEVAPLAVAMLGFLAALLLFAAIGVLVAAFTVLYKQGQSVVSVTVISVSLLSGVYYPTEVLPSLLQSIAELLPTTWALDLLRQCLIGEGIDGARLAGIVLAAAVSLPAALGVFNRALDHARKLGTLGQY